MDDKDRQDTKPETTDSDAETESGEPEAASTEAAEAEEEDELEESLPPPEEDERRSGGGRRRLPWAAVVVLLILIGAGIYAAWPSIKRSIEKPHFAPEQAALPTEAVPPEEGAQQKAEQKKGEAPGVDLVMSDEGLATVKEKPKLPEDIPAPEVAMPDGEVGPPEMAEVAPPEAEGPSAIAKGEAPSKAQITPGVEKGPEVVVVEPTEQAPAATPGSKLDALSERIAKLEKIVEQRVGVPPPAPPDDGQMMSDVLTRMEGKGAGKPSAAPAAPAVNLAPLEARIDSLESRLKKVVDPGPELDAMRIETMGVRDAVNNVDQRLNELESRIADRSAADGRLMSAVLAVDRLAAAAAGSGPFESELGAAQSAGGDDADITAALAELKPFAASGVPTIADLRSGFDTMALRVVRASALPEGGGWIDQTIGRLKRIVAVRKTGEDVEPDSLDGRLMRAEAALARGGLSEAVIIIDKLPGRASEGADDWLAMAKSRLRVDQAVADLQKHMAKRIESRWHPEGTGSG